MKILRFFPLFAFAFLILLAATPSQAQSSGGAGTGKAWLLSKSSEAKAAKRFSLQEWMEGKDHRAMMDMWLSINTPTPYEFMIGGTLSQYTVNTQVGTVPTPTVTSLGKQSLSGEVHAYATIVGVSAQYLNNNEEGFNDITGQFNLRIFGASTQATAITLHYGLRTRTANDGSYRLNQQYPAVTLQIYLTKLFGIYGNYRYYFPITESYYGQTSTDELNAGLFIEYGIIRLFGNFYQERQNSKLNNVETNIERKGSRMGLQFHF